MSRYSLLYVERGKPTADSERFRRRLVAFVSNLPSTQRTAINYSVTRILRAKGIMPQGSYDLGRFFESADVTDVLDAVTLMRGELFREGHNNLGPQWHQAVREALEEQNLTYRLGDDGIVHPFVDQEFEANRAATIAVLSEERFGETMKSFEDAFRHLRNGEGRQAIRMMFPAVETAAKVIFPGRFAGLGPGEVDRYIEPALRKTYEGNQPATDAGRRLLASFKEWINASQLYRHGQKVEEAADPPQELVVAHLSAGATFLRWMIELAG